MQAVFSCTPEYCAYIINHRSARHRCLPRSRSSTALSRWFLGWFTVSNRIWIGANCGSRFCQCAGHWNQHRIAGYTPEPVMHATLCCTNLLPPLCPSRLSCSRRARGERGRHPDHPSQQSLWNRECMCCEMPLLGGPSERQHGTSWENARPQIFYISLMSSLTLLPRPNFTNALLVPVADVSPCPPPSRRPPRSSTRWATSPSPTTSA